MLFVEAAVSCVLILLTFLLNLTLPSIPADAFPRLFLLVSNCLWITLILFLGGRMRARGRMQEMKSGTGLVLHAKRVRQRTVINAYVQEEEHEFLVDNVTEDCLQAVKDFLKMQMKGMEKGMGVQWKDDRIGKTYQLVLMEMDDDDEERWKEGVDCSRLDI